jgi:hypothetical protein
MADEHTWRFELTGDRVPELQVKLEWALQRQNRQFSDAVDRLVTTHPVAESAHRVVPWILRVLGGLGLVLLALIVALDPHGARREAWWLVPAGILFVLVIAIAPYVVQIRERIRERVRGLGPSRRFTGAMLARRAEAIYRKVAAKTPYTIDYHLTADALEARAPALGIVRRFELRLARRVLDGGDVLFVFRRHASVAVYRYIYLASPADHDAVVAALTRAGATIAALTGPVEGYSAPVPEARALST